MSYLFTSGESAEKSATKFFSENSLDYANDDCLQKSGIDFVYIRNGVFTSVDVKNCFELYIGNVSEFNTFCVRHPFKFSTQVDEIWIFDKYKKEWFYQGPLIKYLEKFFAPGMFEKFKSDLIKIDGERVKVNPELYMLDLKNKLKKYLKDGVWINYGTQDTQTYLRMITSSDERYKKSMW